MICEVCKKEHDGSYGSGRFCSRACTGKLGGSSWKEKCKETFRKEYEKNPKKCEQCEKIIEYEKRNNRFCSQSCSATTSNRKTPRRRKRVKLCKQCTQLRSPGSLFCIECKKKREIDHDDDFRFYVLEKRNAA